MNPMSNSGPIGDDHCARFGCGVAIPRRPRTGLVALWPLALGAFASSALASAGSYAVAQNDERAADKDQPDFARDIRPLLSDRCFACHAGAEGEGRGRLDLQDEAVDALGGAAIVPFDRDASALWRRINHSNPARRMPPPEAKLELTESEVELLGRWIDAGASYDQHWAFIRPARSPEQTVRDTKWSRDPLDVLVLAALEGEGLAPAPPADPATLLRRVHLDLTGLPPRAADVQRFLADPSDEAYEHVVDTLLASVEHAEHLASDWLDVARYADTFGYQSDADMHVWPWRDWVVRAFAENLPYDTFVTWQLAGDLLEDAPHDARLATTFNRLHRQTNEGGSVEEEFRVQYIGDRVETMAAAFLGVTIGCARCHDHKFDPITQLDSYALGALFDGIDESGLYSHFTDAVPTPALDLPTPEQAAALVALEVQVATAERALVGIRAVDSEADAAPPAKRFALDTDELPNDVVADGPPARCAGPRDRAVRLSGEDALTFPGAGVFARSDPFSLALTLRLPEHYERAVVLHRSKAWTDSGSRGYQLLIEDGRLTAALVHFWPGDAIAVRSRAALPLDVWQRVLVTYDGSSQAAGLHLYLDSEPLAVEVVRDHLTRTIQGGGIEHLTLGSRFRDRGFVDGEVESITVYDTEVDGAERVNSSAELAAAREELRGKRRERDALRDGIRQIMTMSEAPAGLQRTAYRLHRGAYNAPREAVQPGTPAALPALLDAPVRTRLDLARWLTHPDHPLTARLAVNRLWRLTFSQGLLPAPEDVGHQSAPPRQRALLDSLARDLIDGAPSAHGTRGVRSGEATAEVAALPATRPWDTRAMLRRCVCSSTYRQSSSLPEDAPAWERDPDNELFSRAASPRLSAEALRDGALAAAGLLVRRQGGPPVHPYQPPGLWEEKSGKVYHPSRGEDLYRRTMYGFWRRTSPPPAATLFDAPSREVCTVARRRTESPLQTLALWNDPQRVAAAVALGRDAWAAARTQEHADDTCVEFLYGALASRAPSAAELRVAREFLAEQRAVFAVDTAAASALASYDLERIAHPTLEGEFKDGAIVRTTEANSDDTIERAAAAALASVLLGLDDVVERR